MKLKLKISVLLILTSIVTISQIIILRPHLEYGFSDVDWGYLNFYKMQNPYTLPQFIKNLKTPSPQGGVYTHQIYYMGIQYNLFNLDFKSFQATTHFFKILATITSFSIFLAISGSWLVAVIATILFGFSYSAVGTMYTVATSSDYSGIFSLGIFFLVYWYIVKKNIKGWFWLISTLLLLLLTLFLSTERMYPLPLFIVIGELFLLSTQRKWIDNKIAIKRLTVLILPLILVFAFQPAAFLDFVANNGSILVKMILAGNWNLLLTPLIALGSILIPFDYTHILGIAKIDNFFEFLNFFIEGPFLILISVTFLLGLGLFKKPISYIIQIIVLTLLSCIILYLTASHFTDHLIAAGSINQAIIGAYVLIFAYVSFRYWIFNRDQILIGLFVGPFFAFLFILLTWVGAAPAEVFSGAHRYLTIPALLMSLFLGTIFAVISKRLFNNLGKFKYFKFIAFAPLLLLVCFININVKEIQYFFNYQLFSGFGAQDKNYMRNQLVSYLSNLSTGQPAFFYFDFTEDNINSYYYDNTILGGFKSWMLWNDRINFNKELVPDMVLNNAALLPTLVKEIDGQRGIYYNGKLYLPENVYAFALKDKKVIDIKSQTLERLGFE